MISLSPPRTSQTFRQILRRIDWVVVALIAIILLVAMINLNSAGAGNWTGKIETQLQWLLLGIFAAFAVAFFPYRLMYRFAYVAYAMGIGLLILVPITGLMRNEARRWLKIGAYQFQPSELMKILLIIALARYLHDLASRPHRRLYHFLIPYALVAIPVGLIFVQPDLSTSIICVLIAISMLTLTELHLKGLIGLASMGLVALALGWSGLFMHDYQRSRIDVWFNPEAYADKEGYQTIQAIISVGNGRLTGLGIGQGTQNKLGYLPYRDTDFPFAVFAEEWGFVGTATVLALFFFLVFWALNRASQARDRFSAFLCVGIASLFFWHVLINVGMVLQLFPVTGVTLPFFSLGGSNALTMMLGVGILLNVYRSIHHKKL